MSVMGIFQQQPRNSCRHSRCKIRHALNVNEMKSKLWKLRLFQVAHIMAVPFFGWIGESVRGHGSSAWTLWHWLMAGLALYAALGGFFFRRTLMRRSEDALAKDATDPKALKQWETSQIIGMSMAEGVVVMGLVVRVVLGGTLWQASLFYAVGLLLLLLWTPRLPTKPASN
jgi:F0F1-type ATP synthase membrane subunit c/vacuolar-type H+-ATPase subunit K